MKYLSFSKLAIFLITICISFSVQNVMAQTTLQDGQNAIGGVKPPTQQDAGGVNDYLSIPSYISTLVNTALFFGAIALLGYLAYGGLRWIASDGSSKGNQAARDIIVNAVIGFILLAVAFAVSMLMQGFLGGSSTGTNPGCPDPSTPCF